MKTKNNHTSKLENTARASYLRLFVLFRSFIRSFARCLSLSLPHFFSVTSLLETERFIQYCILFLVCSNGKEMFRPGDKFMTEKYGKHLECTCGMDEVPNCQEVIIGKYLRILNVK